MELEKSKSRPIQLLEIVKLFLPTCLAFAALGDFCCQADSLELSNYKHYIIQLGFGTLQKVGLTAFRQNRAPPKI